MDGRLREEEMYLPLPPSFSISTLPPSLLLNSPTRTVLQVGCSPPPSPPSFPKSADGRWLVFPLRHPEIGQGASKTSEVPSYEPSGKAWAATPRPREPLKPLYCLKPPVPVITGSRRQRSGARHDSAPASLYGTYLHDEHFDTASYGSSGYPSNGSSPTKHWLVCYDGAVTDS